MKIHGGIFDLSKTQKKIDHLESQTNAAGFWDDRAKAESIFSELNGYKKKIDGWKKCKSETDDIMTLFELASESNDESLVDEISSSLNSTKSQFEELKLLEMLNGEFDKNDVYMTIHSGAGGTEACDWVSILYRMYTRWAEQKKYKIEVVDLLEAEGGIKSVTFQISGFYLFGYLQGESGIHRLVRISPFDSNARRHTSFASVYVTPVIDDNIEIDIKPDEIRVDTYRAQGAGGQHVNTTDSAVRITHIPTGIVVQCQNERSQIKNRATAMKILKSRLYEYLLNEQEENKQKNAVEKKDIAWGNQIRSYVFQPYTMVKDHRTKHDIGNIHSVMDGGIDPLLEGYLKWKMGGDQ